MTPKLVLVTGSTDGIGQQTALELAQAGHHVLLHGRDPRKGARTLRAIQEASSSPHLAYFNADLAPLAQVHRLAADLHNAHSHLDVLINNAAVWEPRQRRSADSHEMTFAVNVLAPFALTVRLLDLLGRGRAGRIVNVVSGLQAAALDFDNLQGERRYSGIGAYSLSKSCLIMITYALARRLAGTGITVNTVHPGTIDTHMLRTSGGGGGRPRTEGAATLIHAGFDPLLAGVTGRYFADRQARESRPVTYDEALQAQLWQVAETLSGVHFEEAAASLRP